MAASTVSLLDRPLYSYAEAARLLAVPTETLRRWLEGAVREGVAYAPVIRPEPTGSDSVTWGEFVEAGLLRGYRRKDVSLQHMRPFIDGARQEWGVPYPLAHLKPLIDNKALVYDLQRVSELPPALYLVRARGGQMQLAQPVLEFLDRVEFSPSGDVARYRPSGSDSPVVIDPDVAFGVPQIRGVRTELMAEAAAAGESPLEHATEWGLKAHEIDAALSWEESLKAAA